MGTVSEIVPLDQTESGGGGWSITISDAAPVLSDCHIGDSICCNGACLTVTEFTSNSFKVGVAPETLNRTNFGDLKVGSKVNLERAMAAHTRFGGHMVQGHVDDTVTIISREPDANSLRLQFRVPEATPTRSSIQPYLIEKGFVTLDGASLTITTVNYSERIFGVVLIAHTQTKIDLANKAIGDRVNVEVDMVSKYVEKAVISALGGQRSSGLQAQIEEAVEAEKGDKKEKKLSPYMAYMKQGIARYKEEHPGASHKEAFSKVAAMWGESNDNPNKIEKAVEADDGEKGGGSGAKLSPYMAYMKQGIVKYKKEHPGVPHKEAFIKVAAMWGESNDNPNKSKPKAGMEAPAAGTKGKAAKVESDEDGYWQ